MWIPAKEAWEVVRFVCAANEKLPSCLHPLPQEKNARWRASQRPHFVPLVTISSPLVAAADRADAVARWVTVVCREAFQGYYFLLARHGEVAPLPSCVSGSQVKTNGDQTCRPGLRSCQIHSLLFCSTLVLVSVGNRWFVTLTEWQ